jgi:hypothetical protein
MPLLSLFKVFSVFVIETIVKSIRQNICLYFISVRRCAFRQTEKEARPEIWNSYKQIQRKNSYFDSCLILTCLSTCISACLPVSPPVCRYTCLSDDHLPVCPPDCLPTCLSAHLTVYPPACLPTCLSVHLPVCSPACDTLPVSLCLSV